MCSMERERDQVRGILSPPVDPGRVSLLTERRMKVSDKNDEAVEIVELQKTVQQKNECIDNRNRTLREQEKLMENVEKDRDLYKREFERAAKIIDELRISVKDDEQKLIDSGKELERIAVKDVLGMGRAWSIADILSKLCNAAEILLNKKDYDGDGWEEIGEAVSHGRLCMSSVDEWLQRGE